MPTSLRRRLLAAGLAALTTAAVPLAAVAAPADDPAVAEAPPRPTVTRDGVADPDVSRNAVPADVFEPTEGCYALTSLPTGRTLTLQGGTWVADDAPATPVHFEATALEHYLLLGADGAEGLLLAATAGPKEQGEALLDAAEFHSPVRTTTDLPRTIDDDLPDPLPGDPLADAIAAVPATWGPGIEAAADPSDGADWRLEQVADGVFRIALPAMGGMVLAVDEAGVPALAAADAAGEAAHLRLELTDGCVQWPDVEVNVDGPVAAGGAPWDETRGYIDAHLHLVAYEFLGGRIRCGQPWHRFGVEQALADCSQNELSGARLAEAGFGAGPDHYADGFDDEMWPSFTVPTPRTLTYEQVYYKWLERAWRGGLRSMTVLLVDNNVLCEAWPYKENSCNEMDAVRLQAQRVRELQDYIDAQSGGPGEGWFRIVETPFEAREVINEGKLAIVLGIEVSVLFDCGEFAGQVSCDEQDVLDGLDEVQELGVVQMELVNKFDNAFSGVKGDAGQTGTVVNTGNLDETGHYWRMDTCPDGTPYGEDKRQTNLPDDAAGTPLEEPARDQLAGDVLSATGTSGATLLYPAGPHCNIAGLTDLGRFLLDEMAARGMIFDPDHMSALAAVEALDHLEERGYPGIISSHGWGDDVIYERIYDLGGMVTPYAGSSAGFVNEWRKHLQWVDDRYYFGFGYGADTNGLGGQGGPPNRGEGLAVTYPFEGLGGVAVERQVSGTRAPYDYDADGTAHYGLYADWVEDLRLVADQQQGDGDVIIDDMARGVEAYLQVWERAVGVPTDACVFRPGTDPTAEVRPGMTFEQVLLAAGQPALRRVDGWTYCGTNPGGRDTEAVVTFAADGTVDRVRERVVPPGRGGAVSASANTPAGVRNASAAAGDPTSLAAHGAHEHDHDHGDEGHEGHEDEVVLAGDVTPAGATPAGTPLEDAGPVVAGILGAALLLVGRTRRREEA